MRFSSKGFGCHKTSKNTNQEVKSKEKRDQFRVTLRESSLVCVLGVPIVVGFRSSLWCFGNKWVIK